MRLFHKFLFRRFWLWKLLHRQIYVLLVFGSILIFPTPTAYADSFYPSGDTQFCEFAQAGAISYSSLPVNSVSTGMTYNSSAVKGVTLNWIKSTDFEDIGDVTFPDARRKNGIASEVVVPPNTMVDLDVYYYNFSGHAIEIEEAIFYTSMPNLASGDLTKLGAPGIYKTNTFKYAGRSVTRSGKAHSVLDWKTVPPHAYSNLPKGEKFISFTTIQPLKILQRKVTPEFRDGKLYLKYLTEVKNTSQYNLNLAKLEDTFISGTQYVTSFNLAPNSSKVFEYEDCLCNDYALDFQVPRLKVSDPNQHFENAAIGTTQLFSYEPETRVFYTKRKDQGAPSNWVGVQGDFTTVGAGDFIRVGLMPYDLHTDFTHIVLKPELKTQPIISDEDESDNDMITTEPSEQITLKPEISNTGAYAENVQIQVDFDDDVVRYVGPESNLVDEDTVIMTIPKIDNSEILRPEFSFSPLLNLQPGNHIAAFELIVKAADYSFQQELEAEIQVNAPADAEDKKIEFTLPETTINYLQPASRLASTGQFNFYFVFSFFIMTSIWLANNWRQKLKKFKRLVGLKQLYLLTSPT